MSEFLHFFMVGAATLNFSSESLLTDSNSRWERWERWDQGFTYCESAETYDTERL